MRIASVSNLFARSFIIFVLAYLWMSFYLRSLILVFCISFLIMLVVNYVFILLGKRKKSRAALTRKQHQHMNQIMLQLKFTSRENARKLFGRAFSVLGKDVPTFYPLFNINVTTADIIKCMRYARKGTTIYIASESFTSDVIAFAASLDRDIKLLDGHTVYSQILCPADIFPEITVGLKSKKRLTLSELRQIIFTRAKVRPYIIIGLVILLTSFIVRFNIYYIIVATVLFSFALVSLFAVNSRHDII